MLRRTPVRLPMSAITPFGSLALAFFGFLFLVSALPQACAQSVLISEFMASNDRTLADEDGEYSDWIELYNAGDSSVNLGGWFITDNATNKRKWRFPSVSIGAKKFLVIFASDKDRINTSYPLHMNFALGASGEYLGLIKPDGVTVASEYAPQYPPQQSDVSYGMVFEGSSVSLLSSSAPARAHVPWDNSLGSDWTAVGFKDNSWTPGRTGAGYERASGYESLIGLNLDNEMFNSRTSAYIRVPFTIGGSPAIERLSLRMKYDDGFVAYLNGVRIASANAPATLDCDSEATGIHGDSAAVQFEDFDVTPYRSALRTDDNVLAIHGLNAGALSSDFLIMPELTGYSGQGVLPNQRRFFSAPTPGAANGTTPDQGPILSEIGHTPSVLNGGQNLQVTARVERAFSDVSAVTLRYRVNYGPVSSLPMRDDGAHGDGAAGDGVYGATIPSAAYTSAQMVRYYVTAVDANNRTSRYPLFVNPAQDAEYLGTMVTDPSVVTALPVLYWFVQDPTAAQTANGTRASIFFEGRFYDNIFVRVRGNTSVSWPKKSFKFDMNSGAYFQFSPDVDPVEEFNVNSTYSDKSYMRQVLSWDTYRNAGAPGSLAFHIRVQQNGVFHSVAEWVEQPDEEMLARNGLDPDGALYKMENQLTDAYQGVEKKTRQTEDHSDLQALVTGVTQTGTVLKNYLYDNVDIPETINYLAATALMHDNDHVQKNYYVYRDTDGSGEWGFLPWDKDLTFGRNYTMEGGVLNDTMWAEHDPQSHPFFGDRSHTKIDGFWNRLIDALLREPSIRGMYLRRLRTLMDDLLQPPGTPAASLKFEGRIDALMELIGPDAEADRAKWPTYGSGQPLSLAVSIMKNSYLARRRIHLFNTHGGTTGIISPAPSSVPALRFATVEANPASGNPDEEYIRIENPTGAGADISGWTLRGDIRHTFRPGTVIPANGALYVSPDVRSFRRRSTAPTGGAGLFVQGNYRGHLGGTPGRLQLRTASGVLVTHAGYGMGDVFTALRLTAGLSAAGPDDPGLYDMQDMQPGGEAAVTVDLYDAIRLLRLVTGIE